MKQMILKVFRAVSANTEEARAACACTDEKAATKEVAPAQNTAEAFKKTPAAPSKLDQHLRPSPVKG